MKPISPKTRLKYVDKETNIIYEFKPAIGKQEIALQEAIQYFGQKKPDGTPIDYSIVELNKHLDAVIDSTLTGWTGPEGAPEFTNPPSDNFGLSDKKKMLGIILFINGIGADPDSVPNTAEQAS